MRSSTRPALAIMARAPILGKVKTRLQPQLTPQQSVDIYRAFLRDTIDLALSIETIAPFLIYTPATHKPFFRQFLPSSVQLLPQCRGDLGQRMLYIFEQFEQRGYSSVLIIGSDIPTLQPKHLETALGYLDKSEVCLGPSLDGGYYLIGARRAHRQLFERMPWSTDRVLETTVARLSAANLSYSLLDPCNDIDTFADLQRLHHEIERLKWTREAKVPRWTETYLEQIGI